MEDKIILIKCSLMEATVQKRDMVIKPRAGQKTHVSSFAMTEPAPSGRILHLLSMNPMAIHKNNVIIGVNVAIKVVIVSSRRK